MFDRTQSRSHASRDYRVGGTRVVSNPRGYDDENRRGFDPQLVVEIPDA